MTEVELRSGVYLARDDLYEVGGEYGGKARTCAAIAVGAVGLTTAGHRASPQVAIVAGVARAMGIPCRVFIPEGPGTPETVAALERGAEVVRVSPGYTGVIARRAADDAKTRGWTYVPFGMEHPAAVELTAHAFDAMHLPDPDLAGPDIRRIVSVVGSGMTLSGLLYGMERRYVTVPVVGIVVGADPRKRLDHWAPPWWRQQVTLLSSDVPYEVGVDESWDGVRLDPHYEAKVVPFLEPGDLFWVTGIRASAR